MESWFFTQTDFNRRKKSFLPRIKYPVSSTGQAKAGLVKPGMTNYTKLMLLYMSLTQYSTIPVFHYSMENSHG